MSYITKMINSLKITNQLFNHLGHTPNFLKDSNASSKMKTMEKKGVGVHYLACSTSRVRRLCWNFGMGTRTSDKRVNYSYGLAQTKQQAG
jgi:hypothetical protein